MLLSLPDELLLQVVVLLDLPDIVNLSLLCKDFYTLIIHNEALWRAILRKTFDLIAFRERSPSSPPRSATDLAARLIGVSHEDHLALIYNLHGGIGTSAGRSSSAVSSSSSVSLSSSLRKPTSALNEMKRRFRLFLRNGPASRSKYANLQYRLRIREQVVSYAVQLLQEHEHSNFNVLAESHLFSAIVFDQLLPGTIPALQLERLPSAAAYTLKPNAFFLQQRIDMLRLVFGQRLACSPLPYDLREMQTIVYDSSRFPLFTTTAATSVNRAGAASIARPLGPRKLPDSAWADIDVLCDSTVVPRFDVLLAIINFFVYNCDRNAMVREGLLPFFNTPPDAADFNFKGGETFDFPRDWTGIYGYLAFWDFDLLRRASAGAAATAGPPSNASPVADMRFIPATTAVPSGSAAGSEIGPEPSTPGSTPRPNLRQNPYMHPSVVAASSSASATPTSDEPSSTSPALAQTQSRESLEALSGNSRTTAPTVLRDSATVKLQDQFDGFQVMETDCPSIHGPISFMGRGRDRFDYITYATLAPFDPCYGLPGFARFGMRKEYVRSDYSAEDEDEVVWEYNGVYIPGPKIILGRWRDGTDVSQTNAVEGPFMFFADEL
ncbi:hypothetical protein POJ06DRAFT_261654 [Lipomyces tetrasporus]|uniref:F-box domain-containing protein n=1 Tax=Lipomyces tetrasporus TaxID=54092 RepID=A0AAD7VQ63_9ASCO|nr:uncharacterized protein POJ06DRAFT_261654 [Lipomyces tetrasporus]KAJ8097541.1 hypothetical protein POJ06DRAFT_261654 [Lipomyces tetrasporus]